MTPLGKRSATDPLEYQPPTKRPAIDPSLASRVLFLLPPPPSYALPPPPATQPNPSHPLHPQPLPPPSPAVPKYRYLVSKRDREEADKQAKELFSALGHKQVETIAEVAAKSRLIRGEDIVKGVEKILRWEKFGLREVPPSQGIENDKRFLAIKALLTPHLEILHRQETVFQLLYVFGEVRQMRSSRTLTPLEKYIETTRISIATHFLGDILSRISDTDLCTLLSIVPPEMNGLATHPVVFRRIVHSIPMPLIDLALQNLASTPIFNSLLCTDKFNSWERKNLALLRILFITLGMSNYIPLNNLGSLLNTIDWNDPQISPERLGQAVRILVSPKEAPGTDPVTRTQIRETLRLAITRLFTYQRVLTIPFSQIEKLVQDFPVPSTDEYRKWLLTILKVFLSRPGIENLLQQALSAPVAVHFPYIRTILQRWLTRANMNSLLRGCSAATHGGPDSPLKRFVKNPLYEPKVFTIVKKFLWPAA